ncbi:BNR-4 repeat-containing protein [Sphingobacterium griseoflavum]|uniref:BNR repeat-containing family member n=1 Tax=Sphingobacterium griseoflavum TaxID=1474952 RepID=A0ABQ3HXA6_9SPHI|nr:BNR-4 repeat-containing protein [Sphingobacterium griseoflavum]GHE32165.1 hypothetical protein GCM10017764_14200 [Sphingobacterium griseoflavum]
MKLPLTLTHFTSFLLIFFSYCVVAQQSKPVAKTILNTKANGFKGIWYMIQPTGNEYAFKYSGGLGTYPANHRPFAIYVKEANKTFFCYGGTDENNSTLLHSVSYYDHRTKKVANPTIVLDKKTVDAHDNPVISIDAEGYVWIFSTSHGVERPSYISRSKRPYDIEEFELVEATELVGGVKKPFTNFSYFQVYHDKNKGFLALFSRYDAKHRRVIGYNTSKDGKNWDEWKVLANIEGGHYQVSALAGNKIGVAFDFHPNGKGLDYRTNLYYLESSDWGQSWHTVDQQLLDGPLTERENIALVQDFTTDKLNNYLLDINFDEKGNPLILSVTSKGPQPGPQNGTRDWHLFHLEQKSRKWINTVVTSSDSNYDMGSIYNEGNGKLRIIGPTETGPQAFNPGGEIAAWVSKDAGSRWTREKLLTRKSARNHSYVRRPNNASGDFYGLWADGDGRKESKSYIYFTNRKGEVFRLPSSGTTEFLTPEKLR